MALGGYMVMIENELIDETVTATSTPTAGPIELYSGGENRAGAADEADEADDGSV